MPFPWMAALRQERSVASTFLGEPDCSVGINHKLAIKRRGGRDGGPPAQRAPDPFAAQSSTRAGILGAVIKSRLAGVGGDPTNRHGAAGTAALIQQDERMTVPRQSLGTRQTRHARADIPNPHVSPDPYCRPSGVRETVRLAAKRKAVRTTAPSRLLAPSARLSSNKKWGLASLMI
jgi:hypothetical protein